MPQPNRLVLTVDFSDEEAAGVAGRSTVRTAALDALFSALKSTTDQICDSLARIQRDDGELLDGVVKLHTLAPSVLAFIVSQEGELKGPWVTATPYVLRDIVTEGTGTYICAQAHTSGVFATDLAADKWVAISDSASFVASSVTFTPTGGLVATNVQSALAELDSAAAKKGANLSDLDDLAAARATLAIEQCLAIAVGDETTSIAAGAAKLTFRMPFDCFLNAVRASLSTAGTSATVIDINRTGVSLLSTKLSIDANEKSSVSAATPAVLASQTLLSDEEITIDFDTAGAGAKGVKVYMLVRVF